MPYANYEDTKANMRNRYRTFTPEQKRQHSLKCAERRRQRRLDLLKQFGNKCLRCGYSDPRALQFDHINADSGGKQRNYDRNKLWKEIKTEPHRFQLLCANCNTIKRFENNELN